MRIILGVWLTILVSGLFTIGSAVAPCPAAASNTAAIEDIPVAPNATVSVEETMPGRAAFQATYLSLSITTDKSVYLTGDTVNITVRTNAINTHVRLQVQLPGGSQETIDNFTTNASHRLSWQAPPTSGVVRFTCEGEGTVEVWDTCFRSVCIDEEDCHIESYPCMRSMSVTGNASADIRVFSRTTSISGYIIDTNQRPVPGATVSLTGNTQSTTSNNDGYYEFSSYQLGNNYGLSNQIPTVTETVSVEAIACETQPGKTIQVQAEHGATDVNFTLRRSFYPPGIDLSGFTLDAFSGWPEAEEYSTWQNIMGITIDGPVEPSKLSYGTKDISYQFFNVDNKKLYLVTEPELGRYFLELQGTQNTDYTVAAAATLNNIYSEPVTVSGNIEGKDDQRLRLMLNAGGIELQVIRPVSLLLIIIPTVIGLLGGLAAAYYLTGGKFRIPGKKSAGRKPPKTKTAARTKAKEKSKATTIEEDSADTQIKERPAAKKSKSGGEKAE